MFFFSFCFGSLFFGVVLGTLSSLVTSWQKKRELDAFLYLSCGCLYSVSLPSLP